MVSAPLLLLVLPALLARGGTSASPTDEPAVVLQPAAPLADNRL